MGIFATRSPARPNPICLTTVRLVKRKANVLKVEGLDALDGSPLLDIKPYTPSYEAADEVKLADWMMQLHKEFAEDPFPRADCEAMLPTAPKAGSTSHTASGT